MRLPYALPAIATLTTLVLFEPAAARAIDRVSYPYPGVQHVHRESVGLDLHVVSLDLHAGHCDVVATRPTERRATVSDWAREQRVQIAVNANFYDESTCGLAMGDGVLWHDAYTSQCEGSIAFGSAPWGTRVGVFDSTGFTRHSPVSWARQIVTGLPLLIYQGETYFDRHEPRVVYDRHPRTAVGVSADGGTLVLLVADGRRAGVPGLTSVEMVPLLEEFSVRDAINLDGGGSTTLFIESEGGVVNRPSDRRERIVGNHLGVRVTGFDLR